MKKTLLIAVALLASVITATADSTAKEIRPGVWSVQSDGSGSASASGDEIANQFTQDVALTAVYNLIPANGRTFTDGTGSVTVANRGFVMQSGTTVFGYGTLQSFRAISNRSGMGVTIRAAAKFGTPVASTWVAVGGFTIGDEVSFGYSGETFGVWHRYGGKPEVQTLTVSGAASGGENATVTVNGTDYTVALTGGGTVQQDAQEIAAYLSANATGYDAEQVDDTVIVSAKSDGDKTDTWAFSSSTATASWAETTAGVTKTSTHVAQSSWNGEDYSTLDPSKGNLYQIRYTNGFGPIRYYVMGPRGLRWRLVHTIRWNNEQTAPNLDNPGLHIGAYATSTGATTNSSVTVDHISSFIDGPQGFTRNPRGLANTKSISTTETNILTIRNRRNYNGLTNQAEIRPFFVTLANDGAKSAVFRIRGNAAIGGTQNFQEIGNNLISLSETAGTTASGGRLLATVTVAKGQSASVDLRELGLVVPPTLALTISGEMTSGAAADLTAALTWYEDL